MKRIAFLLFVALSCALVHAQNFVSTTVTQKAVEGHDDLVDMVFIFDIQPGWHVYGPENDGGPTAMTLTFETLTGAKKEGNLRLSPAPKKVQDPIFECEVTFWEKNATATQRLRLTGGAWKAEGYLQYGACNDETCMPPTNIEFSFKGESKKTDSPPALPVREGAVTSDSEGTADNQAYNEKVEGDYVIPSDSSAQIVTAPSLAGRAE